MKDDSDNKYAVVRIDDKVSVRGLVDSGATNCAIDEDLCKKYESKLETRNVCSVMLWTNLKPQAQLQ